MLHPSREEGSIWGRDSYQGRAAVLDPNPLTRSVYGALLERAMELPVCVFSSSEDLCRRFDFSFRFLILDWEMTADIADLIRRLQAASPKLRLGAISDHWDQRSLSEALGLGFSGFFDRCLGTKELAHQLDIWKEYRSCLSPNLLREVFLLAKGALPLCPEKNFPQLTRREQEVRAYAASGLTNQQIADRLSLSKSTVDNHFINIYRKLGIKNRRQLIRMELRQEAPDLIPYTLPETFGVYQKEDLYMNREFCEIYAFFANIFMKPIPVPGEAFVRNLSERIEILLDSEVKLPDEAREAFAAFREECRKNEAARVQERLAVDRTMLFRGTRKEEGPLPPYESFYCSGEQKENTLAALTQFYRECGMKVGGRVHERPDYAGVILACLSELYRREETPKFSGVFLKEHVQNWLPTFCDEMSACAETPFFRGIAVLMKSVILESGMENNQAAADLE